MLKIAVITVSIQTREVAEKVVREGQTDMIALGRQAIAVSGWPNKVKEGGLTK